MKKGGLLSLIVYILYTLGGGGLALYCRIGIDNVNNNGGGWEGLGLAIVMIVGLVFGAAGLVATILKLIHMKSGWGFFGVLCILVDIAFIGVFVSSMIENGLTLDAVYAILFIGASLASLIANIKSMRD